MHRLQAGDWVEVRSKEEILRSLDKNGRLDGLPFMPQMFKYCGQRFRVFKRAHKTCDTVSGAYVGRKLAGGVHLDLRCDGQAYGGCQAACLIFWNERWLQPLEQAVRLVEPSQHADSRQGDEADHAVVCADEDVWKATCTQVDGDKRYHCQATELLSYTTPLAWWDARQYVEDVSSGNVTPARVFGGFSYVAYYYGSLAYRGRLGRPGRWLYDRFQALRGGVPFPRKRGRVPAGQPAPRCDLNLQPGDLVRVKSYSDILATLSERNDNRGMGFDAELVPYCGGEYRVRTRISKFIDEGTGRMKTMRTPAVILEGVHCQSCYSGNRMFCPRSIYSWWREIWLERVPENGAEPGRRDGVAVRETL
jgi:hypothetical protein